MPFGIGVTEMIILLVVLLVFFGPKRLPEMGRSLGKGMREFKDSISGKDDEDEPVQHYSPQLPESEPPVAPDATTPDATTPDAMTPSRERDSVS